MLLLFLSRINNYLLIFNYHSGTIFILDKRILFALCSYLYDRDRKIRIRIKKIEN